MNILYLGPYHDTMISFLRSLGDQVFNTEEPISESSVDLNDIDFVISYRYRHILRRDFLDRFYRKAINLHISYLPWNRGADPNLWSFLEDTPKGVTVHYLNEGIDTGDIIAQRLVEYMPSDTLKTSYDRLIIEMERLFFEIWHEIRLGNAIGIQQTAGGSSHKKRDKDTYQHLLSEGWNTPVKTLIARALKNKC